MKLTSNMKLIKSQPPSTATAIMATTLTVFCAGWILLATDNFQSKNDFYGKTLAESLSALVLEPLLTQDEMDLAAISNRFAEIEGVQLVSVYSLDNKILSSSGKSGAGPSYSDTVVFDDTVMGYVRITLEPTILHSPITTTHVLLACLMLIGIPAISLWILGHRVIKTNESSVGSASEVSITEETSIQYLVGINLYNQIALSQTERKKELDVAQRLVEKLGPFYKSSVHHMPGMGLIMLFSVNTEGNDQLEALFAAFVIIGLLKGQPGEYRIAIQKTEGLTTTIDMMAPEIKDLRLLTAITKVNTVSVGSHFKSDFLTANQIRFQPLIHPLTKEMSTSDIRFFSITSLSASHQSLVNEQINTLLSN